MQDHTQSVIIRHWDKRAEAFSLRYDEEENARWESVLSKFLGADKNKNVIDIGTGTGFLANIIGHLGYPTIGIDISKEMLKYAVKIGKECGSAAIYMENDASVLPFMDGSVDYIVNARFIWTIIEPEKTFKEWFRVLRSGGVVLCFNSMKENVGITVKQRKSAFYHDRETDNSLEMYGASMDEIKEILRKSGFSSVEIVSIPELGKVAKDNIKGEICDYETWFVVIARKK